MSRGCAYRLRVGFQVWEKSVSKSREMETAPTAQLTLAPGAGQWVRCASEAGDLINQYPTAKGGLSAGIENSNDTDHQELLILTEGIPTTCSPNLLSDSTEQLLHYCFTGLCT